MFKLFVTLFVASCAIFTFTNLDAEHNNLPTAFETSFLSTITADSTLTTKVNYASFGYEELAKKPVLSDDIDGGLMEEVMDMEELEGDMLEVASTTPE